MADCFKDARGTIQDLPIPGPVDAVTYIFTRAGAIRGNHVHKRTIQWTYVMTGRLLVATRPFTHGGSSRVPPRETVYDPGMIALEEPGIAHAWKAIADTEVLVFTRGPRSGEAYESDTERLEVPLLT